MTYAVNRSSTDEIFRAHILEALDRAAIEAFPLIPSSYRGMEGSGDDDLPELFKALDAHVQRLCKKYDIVRVDNF